MDFASKKLLSFWCTGDAGSVRKISKKKKKKEQAAREEERDLRVSSSRKKGVRAHLR